ncbi:MAG: flagellar motor switch protein FliM, partial [Aquificota bacterium]
MAEEFLTQEEVNLLLQTLGKEEEKKQVIEEGGVKPLDLSLFEHISLGRIPGLELIFEKWISGLKRGLASMVASIPTIFKEGMSIV